jgi:predicted DNA-binding transcriptional regulator YafY
MAYGKFQDMLKLAEIMQGTALSLDDIADRAEVDRRTAERIRDALRDCFGEDFLELPREEPQKYFKIRSRRLDQFTLSTLASFTDEELAAFPTAVAILRRDGLAAQADILERALIKVKSLVKPDRRLDLNLEDLMKFEGLALRPGPKLAYDEGMVHTLREAMRAFRQVKISYVREGRPEDYMLIPMGFLYGERQHYLVARHADGYKKEPHHFILSRIRAVEILEEVFEEDKNFSLAAHAARSFGVFQEEPFEVEWLFSPEAAAEAEKFLFHPSQEMSRNADGSLTVRFTAGARLEMAWHLCTWGRQVKVVKPAGFWESVRERLPEF